MILEETQFSQATPSTVFTGSFQKCFERMFKMFQEYFALQLVFSFFFPFIFFLSLPHGS